jgi:hypothetical protein
VKKVGYILLQVSGYLILLAGIADFAMTFYTNALPVQHLKYLKIKAESVSLELTTLDHAFSRPLVPGPARRLPRAETITWLNTCGP